MKQQAPKVVIKGSDGVVVALQPDQRVNVKARAGMKYRLLRDDAQLDAVVATREGDNLHLNTQGGEVVLEGFYVQCGAGACAVVDLPGANAAGLTLDGSSAAGTSLGSGSSLVYAYGGADALSSLGAMPAGHGLGAAGWSTGAAGQLTYFPATVAAAST